MVFGIVASLVIGAFIWPVLILCGLFVLLAFRRAKVVSGRSVWKVQIPGYLTLAILFSGASFLIQREMKNAIPVFAGLVASAVVKQMPLPLPANAAPPAPSSALAQPSAIDISDSSNARVINSYIIGSVNVKGSSGTVLNK